MPRRPGEACPGAGAEPCAVLSARLRTQDEEDEKEAALEKEKFEAVKAKVGVLLCHGMRACTHPPACLLLWRGRRHRHVRAH